MNTKYYKALLKETMESHYGNMRYELNKEYVLDDTEPLKLCENGFHYTSYIALLPMWYNDIDYDVYEVEPLGKVLKDADEYKFCTDKIKILRKLSDEEIKEIIDKELDILVHDIKVHVRAKVAEHGRDKDFDILVNDTDWGIRFEVAYVGRDKDLDILVNDEDDSVRREVARHGRDKDLDILVNDKDWYVRYIMAKHGRDKDLDILVHDKEYAIRREVAKHGRDKDLDILVNDINWSVRCEVARHSRDKDLDILVNDEEWAVIALLHKLNNRKEE